MDWLKALFSSIWDGLSELQLDADDQIYVFQEKTQLLADRAAVRLKIREMKARARIERRTARIKTRIEERAKRKLARKAARKK